MVAIMDTMGVLNRIKFEHAELVQAAEAVLLAMSQDPRSVAEEDKIVFKWLGWTEKDISRELGRVQQLQRWRPQAGSSVEYAESVEMHSALLKSVPKKVSELQSKIDELQEKIDFENNKLNQAQTRLDSMDNARKILREIVPRHVRKQFDDEIARIRTSESYDRLRELRSRKEVINNVLENLSRINADTIGQILLHAEAIKLANIIPPPSKNREQPRIADESAWYAYIDLLRLELPSVEAELSELQITIDEWFAEAEQVLDFYLEAK